MGFTPQAEVDKGASAAGSQALLPVRAQAADLGDEGPPGFFQRALAQVVDAVEAPEGGAQSTTPIMTVCQESAGVKIAGLELEHS